MLTIPRAPGPQRHVRPRRRRVDVDAYDERVARDPPVGGERAEPVAEPERAAAVLRPELDHDVRARAPQQVLVDAQVLGELGVGTPA